MLKTCPRWPICERPPSRCHLAVNWLLAAAVQALCTVVPAALPVLAFPAQQPL